MSFISKRERVFNDYELLDLPPRNECKLKAYSSCTDARAWSHFGADKSEHLVEIIKRNNETCAHKYVPTNVIVDTLMVNKNIEIARLKRKIEEFEQMLAVYDQLDLDPEQRLEIAKAHEEIRRANKDLEEMYLDLDHSAYTEGTESEHFETGKFSMSGKSRGDECPLENIYILRQPTDTKYVQYVSVNENVTYNAETMARDPRIDELQEMIICKDAQIIAMRNTIAVLENDVCEPYCIYAHIYTALEKIFGVLSQNETYKQYLSMLTGGNDTRMIDIKGKILFKMKLLEKFCLTLITPCSDDEDEVNDNVIKAFSQVARAETTTLLTPSPGLSVPLESKRAQLVAEILESEDIKEYLKDEQVKRFTANQNDMLAMEHYSIDAENIVRLKALQTNYDELVTCYEDVKYERDMLLEKCAKCNEINDELNELKNQLKEYASVWTEKEYYRKRSEDLDSLKENVIILAEETSSLETQYNAEAEISNNRMKKIDELRASNLQLEDRLNDLSISFEKQQNSLQCKLKEAECHGMCQEQQIKSLSAQIELLLEQHHDKPTQDLPDSILLMHEIEAQKDQINNLNEKLISSEEEKKSLHDKFNKHLDEINDLKRKIDTWKSNYVEAQQRNACLEGFAKQYKEQLDRTMDLNQTLSDDMAVQKLTIENLARAVDSKSEENKKLKNEINFKHHENNQLLHEIQELRDNHESLSSDRNLALESLELERNNSKDLQNRIKKYDENMQRQALSTQKQMEDYDSLKSRLQEEMKKNADLKSELAKHEQNNSMLLREITRLQMGNMSSSQDLDTLKSEKEQLEISGELVRKQSKILEQKLSECDLEQEKLKDALNNLRYEKKSLEMELHKKSAELEHALSSFQMTQKKSDELLTLQRNLEEDLSKSSEEYKKLVNEKVLLQNELAARNREIKMMVDALDRQKNQHTEQTTKAVNDLFNLQKQYDELLAEKNMLQVDFDNKTLEINHLYNTLESKIEENRDLNKKIRKLEDDGFSAKSSIEALEQDKKERDTLLDKMRYYESLESEFQILKKAHDEAEKAKEALELKLKVQLTSFKKIEKENQELSRQTENIRSDNKTLELKLAAAKLDSPNGGHESSYGYIMAEVEALKKEKLDQQNKIKDLLDRLDQTDNLVLEMKEELVARNDKIAILENHINALEEEIRELHKNMEHAVATGEEMREVSLDKIDHTLKKMEAHHSKATHNMKLEIAKLNEHKNSIEEGLSLSKSEAERANNEKFRLELNISQLQNEKELVATEIKQLEISTVGDSNLSPRFCEFDAIITSLNRIARAFDGVSSKKSNLENTLLKVQTSSHIVLNKADEAKKIAEKEKQKVINEKEEAIRQRLKLEKQVEDLKADIDRDKEVIHDLKAEILNQKLLMDKINQSTQDYISKLNDELESLQKLYQDTLDKNKDYEERLKNALEKYQEKQDTVDKINKELELQRNEILALQKELAALNNKTRTKNVAVQTNFAIPKRNMATESPPEIISIQAPELNEITHKLLPERPGIDEPYGDIAPNQNLNYINELMVQRANVDPTYDLFRSSYQSFKTKQLTTGPLEQHSFASTSQIDAFPKVQDAKPGVFKMSKQDYPEIIKNINDSLSPIQTTSEINEYNFLKQQKPLLLSSSDHILSHNAVKNPKPMHENEDEFPKYGSDKLNYSKKDPKVAKKITLAYDKETNDKGLGKHSGSDKHKNEPHDLENGVKSNQLVHKLNCKEPVSSREYNDRLKYNDMMNKASLIAIKNPTETDITFSFTENLDITPVSFTEGEDITPFSFTDDQDMLVLYKDRNRNKIPSKEVKHPWTAMDNVTVETVSVTPKSIGQPSKLTSRDQDKTNIFLAASPRTYLKDSKTRHPENIDAYTNSFDTLNTYSKGPNSTSVEAVDGDISTERDRRGGERISDFTFDSKSEPKIKTHSPLRSPLLPQYMKIPNRDLAQFNYWPETVLTDPIEGIEGGTNSITNSKTNSSEKKNHMMNDSIAPETPSTADKAILVKTEPTEYETKIEELTKALENMEKDCKKKLEVIKLQYDANVKSIINEHNEGVKSIQNLHEETLQDIIKIHENEIESLRSMSIDAMRKVDKLEKENDTLKVKVNDCSCGCNFEKEKPTPKSEHKKRKTLPNVTKVLTKTNIEAFNVKPKILRSGPCTCSIDTGVNETIKSIFEQVDMEQRKLAEIAYIKYIANKILSGNMEKLDGQELSFLHYKVCRSWKQKLSKEEAIQKRIDTLESELLHKQRNAQQHIAELDRRVAEERRLLDVAREAVCPSPPGASKRLSGRDDTNIISPPAPPSSHAERDFSCSCQDLNVTIAETRSAGDPDVDVLMPNRPNRSKYGNNRAVLAKLYPARPERRLLDETPTRLKRDRLGNRHRK